MRRSLNASLILSGGMYMTRVYLVLIGLGS